MNTIITIEPTISMFLIVCPFLFLAGLVDAIGGGGGLISLPAYLIAGLPTHTAIATNKLSSTCGTTLATARFIKNGLVNFKLAVPSVIMAIIGSAIGAHISLIIPEKISRTVYIIQKRHMNGIMLKSSKRLYINLITGKERTAQESGTKIYFG